MRTLTKDQNHALAEIMCARRSGGFYLLTGPAGSGKTYLMKRLVLELLGQGLKVIVSAPTHKAVAVVKDMLRQSDIEVQCTTIHDMLGLVRGKSHSKRLTFVRKKNAREIRADVVVIDECSMVSSDLMGHIKRHLSQFVLFVGDSAQLPPIGEKASETFSIADRSHLNSIVRQSSDNPLLDAADTIRRSQGRPMDMSWCKPAMAKPKGVYLPGKCTDAWMQKAFLSKEFSDDPDSFRYLCYTNEQVARVNQKVRIWRYGGLTRTPFMPDERVLVRSPVFADDGKTQLLATSEEATVVEIRADEFERYISYLDKIPGWEARIPSWRVTLLKNEGDEVTVHIPRDNDAYNSVIQRICEEAQEDHERWDDYHAVNQSIADLQCIYAMTVHKSQGSTFKNVFVDVDDIMRRAKLNVLETQQLLYVAVTRPTHALMLVGGRS